MTYPIKGAEGPDIRCPACMDQEMLSNVTVYWISNVEDAKVLQCACDRGHEFEEAVTNAD